MKITNKHTSTYNKNGREYRPNFGWVKVCSGNIIKPLKKGTKEIIPVDFCMLGREDEGLIYTLDNRWGKTDYGEQIIDNFLIWCKQWVPNCTKYKFFMVIPSQQRPPKNLLTKLCNFFKRGQRTKQNPEPFCLAMIRESRKNFKLCFIQTDHNILSKAKEERLSGAGQIMLYGISRYIRTVGAKSLKIYSKKDEFYKRLFHERKDSNGYFTIKPSELTRFINATREKYEMQKDWIPLPPTVIEKINKSIQVQ